MTSRQTQAQRWLAAGHRYDDVSLWQELCELVAARGTLPTVDLPAHLAPLVFRDPENIYLPWLREQHLFPFFHVRGKSCTGGNGWKLLPDWEKRLAVMRNPTPSLLLHWWQELEPIMHQTCIKLAENIDILVYDPDLIGLPFRTVGVTRVYCSLCKSESSTTDARGIVHRWNAFHGRADCPMLHLHVKLREAQRSLGQDKAAAALEAELQRLAQAFLRQAEERDAATWRALVEAGFYTTIESAANGRMLRAALHVAQVCAVWIYSNPESVREYATFLRGEGDWPHSRAEDEVQRQIKDMYVEAADRLEALIANG